MRISDWSSDVCSSDLAVFNIQTGAEACDHRRFIRGFRTKAVIYRQREKLPRKCGVSQQQQREAVRTTGNRNGNPFGFQLQAFVQSKTKGLGLKTLDRLRRSEEHTSELQSLMRISYAVFCLKKQKQQHINS